MKNDKARARKGEWRVPEKHLWIIAFVGGATGAWIGMKRYRHKTQHSIFKYGLPSLSLIELYLVYWVIF